MIENKRYIIGLGCRRGVSYEAIASAVSDVLLQFSIEKELITYCASVDLKADEAGLLAFAKAWGLDIIFFPKAALEKIDVPNPSGTVLDKIGILSVAEASALITARDIELENKNVSYRLIVEKQKYGNITVAVVELIMNIQNE